MNYNTAKLCTCFPSHQNNITQIKAQQTIDFYVAFHRRRLANLAKIHGPQMGHEPKCSIFHGFSYETFGWDPKFKLQFLVFLYVFLL
jgi:hypothetical protein